MGKGDCLTIWFLIWRRKLVLKSPSLDHSLKQLLSNVAWPVIGYCNSLFLFGQEIEWMDKARHILAIIYTLFWYILC